MKKINVKVKEFVPANIPRSTSMLIVAAPKSGKSTFTKRLVYENRDRYAYGIVFNGVERDYQEWCKINGPLFTNNSWDNKIELNHLNRTKLCISENGIGYRGNCTYNIIDDVLNTASDWKSSIIKYLVSKGTQHHDQLTVICAQYIMTLPPEFRTSCQYFAIGGTIARETRNKLFKSLPMDFGGSNDSENYDIFSKLIDEVCGKKYRFLIICPSGDDNGDKLFYYDVSPPPEFTSGTKESWEWNDTRYDKNYKEVHELKID